MTRDEFWKYLDELPAEEAEEALRARLEGAEVPALIEFQAHFDQLQADAYRWMLWGAAYIINGGCSDDGFIDFRYGLISRGKAVYEAALVNPDSLFDVVYDQSDEDDIENELFGYVAAEVYESKTGNELPSSDIDSPSDPLGDQWDFDNGELCAKHLPKLWAKFADLT